MSQHLYEISKEFVELQEAASNADQVDESMMLALQDTMEGIQLSFEEKAQNVVGVMKNVTSTVSALDEEIKRLQAKKATAINKEKWFKDYLRENMEKTGISNIKCDLFSITLSKPSQTVEITAELELPDDLIEIETKIKPNKTKIKELLKAGEDISGAVLKDTQRRLTIR
jgi:Uri superfamily endonuclease